MSAHPFPTSLLAATAAAAVLAGGLISGGATAAAEVPRAPSAEPPPLPGSPHHPAAPADTAGSRGPRFERPAAVLRAAAVRGRAVKVALDCRTSGRVTVNGNGARSRAVPFRCRDGKAQATLRAPHALTRALQDRSSVRAVFEVESGGRSTPTTVLLRRDPKPGVAQAASHGLYSRAFCMGNGSAAIGGGTVSFSIDYADWFGAAYGEAVYWRVWLYWVDSRGGYGSYTDQPYMLSYRAATKFGQSLGSGNLVSIGGGGASIGLSGSHAMRVDARRLRVHPFIETWTARAGYRSTWLPANVFWPATVHAGGCLLP